MRLKEVHPDLFEEAKRYEEQSVLHGEEFFWNAARVSGGIGTARTRGPDQGKLGGHTSAQASTAQKPPSRRKLLGV